MNIEITELTKHYGATRAIDGISVALPGEVRALVLIGPSGGGKSTLLRLLGGLEVPTSGDIRRNGRILPATEAGQLALRRRNGFLFQSFNLFPHLSALENIVLPLVRVHRWQREDAIGRAREVVARFGMEDHVTKMPGELSGGQQQRIALARAMAHEPDLLLLDEPTSALDPEMKAEVLDIVAELCEAGQRIILSTHEMGFARSCADEVIFLANGRLVESGKGSALFESPQTEVVRTFLGRVMKW